MKIIETRSYVLIQPRHAVALIMDSPNSGATYPDDFGYTCRLEDLCSEEDTHVDKLWSVAPSLGVTLLAANAPRSYIDCNCSLTDVDCETNDNRCGVSVHQADLTDMRHGVVWRNLSGGSPIYSVKLSPLAVRSRIESYYLPYHDALRKTIKSLRRKHGVVWHLNLHSVTANEHGRFGTASNKPLTDFVLDDCDGTSCAYQFTKIVTKLLRELGYTVSINKPGNLTEIVTRHGRPRQKRHSLQVGVRRNLYMDERTREPNAGFELLRADLALVTKSLVSTLSDLTKKLYKPKVPSKRSIGKVRNS
ncbi:N-formylglutamate amidohydrolase [Undibacterium sp. TS12]|uniref:N-formylglutamate amidohydrolase n=1 Tax=Undibacterium sp. TS12 TaxID=2908202 RepID=UPI001F4CFB7E|nr:N-formylglutamate amidohydrolase [Undibacterium sp. TS12]